MRKILYYAGMALIATSVLVACNQDDVGKTPDTPGGGGGTVRLAVPQPSFTDTTETSVTVTWEAIPNAASYTYALNGTEGTTTEPQYVIETPNTGDYSFRVKAVPAEGSTEYTESQWSPTITYNFQGFSSGPVEALSQWFGTYTVTSEYGILAQSDATQQGVAISKVSESVTLNITISEYPYEGGDSIAYITGWSSWASAGCEGWEGESIPGWGMIDTDGNLYFLTDQNIGELTDGIDGVWLVMGYVNSPDYTGYSTITGTGYGFVMTRDGDNVSVVIPEDAELSDGGTFAYEAVDIFGTDGTTSYYFNLPRTYAAGGFTVEQTGSTSATDIFNMSLQNVRNLGISVFAAPSFAVAK